MKHAIFTLTSIVVALGVTSAAWADASADAVKSFAQYITYLQQVAPQALKLGPIDAGIVYLKNESRLDFPADALSKLTAIAVRQTTQWHNTILTGEIRVVGTLVVDSVAGLYSGSTLIGYRMTYGESGFDLDSCKSADLSTCHIGEVREAVFVTPDFSHVEVDNTAVASLRF